MEFRAKNRLLCLNKGTKDSPKISRFVLVVAQWFEPGNTGTADNPKQTRAYMEIECTRALARTIALAELHTHAHTRQALFDGNGFCIRDAGGNSRQGIVTKNYALDLCVCLGWQVAHDILCI